MLRTLTVLALALLAARVAYADTPNITLGPAILTYPEIVKQLNIQGRHLRYDSRLRDRAAYIYLKQRSWAETRSLLSEGLEIRFRQKQDQPDTWVMEPDPGAQAREDRWFQDYAANIRFLLHQELQPVLPYMDISYAALWNEYQTFHKQLDEQLLAARNDESLEDPEISQQFLRLEEQYHNMRAATDLGIWLAAHLIRAGLLGDPIDILQGDFTVRMARVNSLVDKASLSTLKALDNIDGDALLIYGWDYYQKDITPFVSFHCITPDEKDESFGFDLNYHPTTGQLFDGTLSGVGILPWATFHPSLTDEAQKWLLARRTETRAFLNTDIAKKPFPLRSAIEAGEVSSVSEVIESWSHAQDAEAVMELWPLRENFDNLARPPGERIYPSGRLMNLTEFFNDPEAQPGATDDRAGAWTLHDRSGVLLVTNRLAFLDRYRQLSLPPFLKMQAKMLARKVQQPGASMLADFCQQTNPAQYEAWRSLEQYRGIDTQRIRDYPAIYIWNNLPEKDRRQIEHTVRSQPFMTYPLDRLAPRVLAQLQTILQGFRLNYIYCWRPDFFAFMSHCTMVVDYDKGKINRPPGFDVGVLVPGNRTLLFKAYLVEVPDTDPQASSQNLPAPIANR